MKDMNCLRTKPEGFFPTRESSPGEQAHVQVFLKFHYPCCTLLDTAQAFVENSSAGHFAEELGSTRNVLLRAAGEQEDFRPLFLPGPPALVLWSCAVPRGLSQSNGRQNATGGIRGEPLSAGSPAGRGFQRRGPKFQPGPGAQPGHPTVFPPPAGGNAP